VESLEVRIRTFLSRYVYTFRCSTSRIYFIQLSEASLQMRGWHLASVTLYAGFVLSEVVSTCFMYQTFVNVSNDCRLRNFFVREHHIGT